MNKSKFTDIVRVLSGGTPKTNISEYWDGDIFWLSIADFKNVNKYVYSTEKRITQIGVDYSNTQILHKGDIIISARGTIGALAVLPYPMAFNQSCFGLRTKSDGLNQEYLFYFLKNYISILQKKKQGSVFDTINTSTFDMIEIFYPSLQIQNKIASILGSIDNKIENNIKINNELESLAKTIYDYWFLQFDFPIEEGKPYKSSGGAMVWNDKLNREIPAKWSVVNFTSMADWESNSQPPKSTFIYEERNGYVRFLQNRDYESDQYKTFIPYSKTLKTVDRFDILMDKYGDAGALHYGKRGTYNVAMGKIKPSKGIYQEYLRSFLSNDGIYHYLHNSCMASTRASLGEDNLSMLYLPLPTNDILEKYQNLIHLIREEILQLKDESEELTDLRDFLLPLLMNGQVGFKDK